MPACSAVTVAMPCATVHASPLGSPGSEMVTTASSEDVHVACSGTISVDESAKCAVATYCSGTPAGTCISAGVTSTDVTIAPELDEADAADATLADDDEDDMDGENLDTAHAY